MTTFAELPLLGRYYPRLPPQGAQCVAWEAAAQLDRRTLTDWIRIRLDDAAERELKAAEKDDSK